MFNWLFLEKRYGGTFHTISCRGRSGKRTGRDWTSTTWRGRTGVVTSSAAWQPQVRTRSPFQSLVSRPFQFSSLENTSKKRVSFYGFISFETVIQRSDDVRIKSGNDVMISCHVDRPSAASVSGPRWFRNGHLSKWHELPNISSRITYRHTAWKLA